MPFTLIHIKQLAGNSSSMMGKISCNQDRQSGKRTTRRFVTYLHFDR